MDERKFVRAVAFFSPRPVLRERAGVRFFHEKDRATPSEICVGIARLSWQNSPFSLNPPTSLPSKNPLVLRQFPAAVKPIQRNNSRDEIGLPSSNDDPRLPSSTAPTKTPAACCCSPKMSQRGDMSHIGSRTVYVEKEYLAIVGT